MTFSKLVLNTIIFISAVTFACWFADNVIYARYGYNAALAVLIVIGGTAGVYTNVVKLILCWLVLILHLTLWLITVVITLVLTVIFGIGALFGAGFKHGSK